MFPLEFPKIEKMIQGVLKVFDAQLCSKQLTIEVTRSRDKFLSKGAFLAEWPIYELILFHLIGNAVKFSKTGGNVWIFISF